MTAALEGNLQAFKLPDVLSFLATTRKSGTLTLASGNHASYVYFDNGNVIFAAANNEDLRLSSILLRRKQLARADFQRIDDIMRRDGGQFGQLAVQHGLIDEAQLRDWLKVQVSEIIFDALMWAGGTFSFGEETQLPAYAVTIAVDLSNLIMEGARRIAEWEQCLRLLPDNHVVFRVVSNPEKEEKITLSRDEWRILFLINGQRTLEELCHDAQDDALVIYRVVYGLLANKLIEPAPHATAPGADDSGGGTDTGHIEPIADATMRQAPVTFSAESTVRETPPDDTELLVSSDARYSYRDVVKPVVAQLSVVNGDLAGVVYPLIEPEYLIGRRSENQIQITDLGISGFHARVFRGPEGFTIEDLKSRNGTWVNATRIFHATLGNGDRIRLGSTELEFQILAEG